MIFFASAVGFSVGFFVSIGVGVLSGREGGEEWRDMGCEGDSAVK